MPPDHDRIEQIEKLMSQVGSFLGELELMQLGLDAEIDALRKAVAEKLTLLRTSLRGLKTLKERDPFGKDPALATERDKYNRDVARVETDWDLLMPRVRQLHKTLKGMPEGKTLADRLAQIVDKGPGRGPIPPPQLEYTRDGEEIAIDRRWEVATFHQMLNRDRRIPQRILAFEVAGGKGKTRLMKRFEYFCESRAGKGQPVLYAKVDFRDRPLSPHSLAYELATTVLDNARAIDGELLHCRAPLEELCAKIRESEATLLSRGQARAPDLELKDLARKLAECLRTIAREWTVVLILDSFEQAGEGGDWFLGHCLPTFKGIDGVIVVLSGREGLRRLESSEEVLFRDTLEPVEHWEDCQRMAELHYQLPIGEEQAKRIIGKYQGDLQGIDMLLKALKDFPHLVDFL